MTRKSNILKITLCALIAFGTELFAWFLTALTAEGTTASALRSLPFPAGRMLAAWAVLTAAVLAVSALHKWNTDSRFCERLGEKAEKNRKKILFCVLAVLLLMFAFRINDSNMRGYQGLLAGNMEQTYMFSLGTPRGVRSDEWQGIAANFHSDLAGDLKLLWQGADSALKAANNVIKMLNPFHWGALYMHMEYTLSWDYLLVTAVSFWGFFRLLEIITGGRGFALAGAFILTWSPQFQWWWGPRSTGLMACLVACFYDFFKSDKIWKKCLLCWALVCLSCEIVEGMYAWDVPTMYLYALILIGIYLNEKKICFRKSDIPYIAAVVAFMGVIVLGYFFSGSGEYVGDFNTIIQTEYPGKRFDAGGGLSFRYLENYFTAPFLPWKDFTLPSTNISETAAFLSLFPLPLLIFILRFRELKKNKVLWGILAASLFCLVYMFIGFPDSLAALTLMSFSMPNRCADIFGFAMLLLLLLECYYSVPLFRSAGKDRKTRIGLAVVLLVMAGFYGAVILTRPDFNYFIGGRMTAYWTVLLLILSGMLFLGMKKNFLLIMCLLTLFSGVAVNPINSGCAIMNDMPLARQIRSINEQDPGLWLTLHDEPLGKYVYAQGPECITYINWPPDFALYGAVDPDGENVKVYNRYAHVVVELTEEETSFTLNGVDKFTVYLNYGDLEKWNVKYVAMKGETLSSREGVGFELAGEDPYDGINIYRVVYS